MYRTHNCGELRKSDINSEVILSGWVQRIRNKGFLIWIDLRDRYGITQILINSEKTPISLFILVLLECLKSINFPII